MIFKGQKMFVHESGVGYTLYIQNDRYATIDRKVGAGTASEEETKSLNDYLKKIEDNIPELKAAKESGTIGIGVYILPSASSTVQTSIDKTTQKMLDEGTDETILKDVLGIVKDNYSMDIEYGANGVAHIKNLDISYDMDALNNVLSKFEAIYGANGELVAGLGKFKDYVNEAFKMLKDQANPSNDIETTTSNSDTKNDLVDTFIQEMDKSKDGATTGADELNKKLYKNYIKSLTSSLTGGLLQQHS